jgi:hypothetical protein
VETLKLGETLETREAQVLLDPTLKPGKYRMQLRVVSRGGESEPAELRIVVLERRDRDPRVPVTPVLDPRVLEPRVTPVISRVAVPMSVMAAVESTPTPTPTPSPKPKAKAAVAKPKAAPKPKPKPKPKPPGKPKRK